MTYPYNDGYMVFDEQRGQYVLTAEYALNELGLNLGEMINERNVANKQNAVKRILRQVSNQIYNYIHLHNDSILQDLIIKKTPSARLIIQEAMGEQLLYLALKGDLSRSTEKEKRELAIDENAKAVLRKTLPELGICLLYTGSLRGLLC